LSLIFVNQSYDQIKNVRDFLAKCHIGTSNILKTARGTANMVAISEFRSVKRATASMLPFLCKKEVEGRAALDYYEGRATGNQLVAIFTAEVKSGSSRKAPQ